jgi:5-formyltetrahydrofolate cyclo-ligase
MISAEKKELRKEIRKLKEQLSPDKKKLLSGEIFHKVETLPVFRDAKFILLYWSMDDEVFTHDFVIKWSNLKRILLPVTLETTLEIKEFKGTEKLQQSSKLNIYEPEGPVFTALDTIDLVIIPGMAFDKNHNRMGRGKGYYDKLLPSLKAYKLGICFDFQLLDHIPYDKNDVKMDGVITNEEVIM